MKLNNPKLSLTFLGGDTSSSSLEVTSQYILKESVSSTFQLFSSLKSSSRQISLSLKRKTQAESILSQLGLPRSVAIDAFYRQIIIHGGIPFDLTVSQTKVPVYDEMTQSEFNQMLAKGIEQIKRGETVSMDEVFGEIEADWKK